MLPYVFFCLKYYGMLKYHGIVLGLRKYCVSKQILSSYSLANS
jgi:hypothetical protein